MFNPELIRNKLYALLLIACTPAGHVPGGRRYGHGFRFDDCCADVLRKGKLDSWRLP